MAIYLSDVVAAIRARVVAVWPEVAAHGVWESEESDSVPWEKLTPPYAVIVFGEAHSADWAADSLDYEFEPEVYYVGTGDLTVLRAKLEALRDDVFFTTGLSVGQVLDVAAIGYGDYLPPNAIFAAKNYGHQAGMIRLKVLYGEYGRSF